MQSSHIACLFDLSVGLGSPKQQRIQHGMMAAELDQLLLKCISITKYKLHFFKVIQILFSITLAMTGKRQNTFLESN